MNRFLVNLITADDGDALCSTTDGRSLSVRFAAPQSASADTSGEDMA